MTERERLLVEAAGLQKKLGKLAQRLAESYDACEMLDLHNPGTADLMLLESLSARFERGIDVLLRSFLRLLDTIEGSEGGTVIDALGRAEKRGLIASAEDFYDMRHTRNRIAHEYLDIEALEMSSFVRKFAPVLLEALRRAEHYPIT